MTKLGEPIENDEKRKEDLKDVVEIARRPNGGFTARKAQEQSTRNKTKRRTKKEEVLP